MHDKPKFVSNPQSLFPDWDLSVHNKFEIKAHLPQSYDVHTIEVEIPNLPVDCITFDSSTGTLDYIKSSEPIQCAIRISAYGEISYRETIVAYNHIERKQEHRKIVPSGPHLGWTVSLCNGTEVSHFLSFLTLRIQVKC